MIYFILGLIIGLIIGFILGWVLKPAKKVTEKTKECAKEDFDLPDAWEHKAENLAKARSFIKGKTKITNDDLQAELSVSDATIVRYLNELEQEGAIKQIGKTGQSVYYKVL